MHHIHHHSHRNPAERSVHAGHMEHPSKRRRVERRTEDRSLGDDQIDENEQEFEISISEQTKIRGGLPKLVLPASGDKAFDTFGNSRQEMEAPLEPLDSSRLPVPKLGLRQVLPAVDSTASQATGVAGAVVAPVAPVVNGVANTAIRAVSGSTGSDSAAPAPPTTTAPGYVQPPAAIAAQDARESALAAEQAQAKEDDRLPPPPPSPNAAPNPAIAASISASPGPMSIQVPGSSSQKILSSPPTPLPATPEASANPSSSYFSSPASAGVTPSSDLSAAHSTGSPSLSKTSTTNSTMSSTSITGSITSSATNTANFAANSMDAALLAALSASRSSLSSMEAMSSITGDESAGSSSMAASLTSATTMMTMTSSSQGLGSASVSGTGPASVGAGAGGVGGASNTAVSPTSTSSSGVGSGAGSSKPATPALIGGIVGGISGLVLVLLAALLLLRWKKGRLGSGERRTISPPMLQSSGPAGGPQSGTGTTGTGTTGTMTQRSSTAPIAAAGFFGRLRPSSSQTATTADTAPSERGFQKISGRKLPSVLTSGGDGYGVAVGASAAGAAAGVGAGTYGASRNAPPMPQQKGVAPGQGPFAGLAPALRPSPPHSLSGSSFYRDSKGFYGGVVPESTSGSGATEPGSGSPTSSSPTFPSPLAIAGGAKDTETPSRKPTMRPGPARTPIIMGSGAGPPPRPERATPPPAGAQDTLNTLGRSHPSEDGSRASRFRESTTPP